MNSLRTPGAARSLLLLVVIALLMHFFSSAGLSHPGKDRFDFSAAICGTAPAAVDAAAGSDRAPTEHHNDGSCCDLCCTAAVPLATSFSPGALAVEAGELSSPAHSPAAVLAPRWAPQSARAPPVRS